jgi:hypothetical protein
MYSPEKAFGRADRTAETGTGLELGSQIHSEDRLIDCDLDSNPSARDDRSIIESISLQRSTWK